jgi:hypothetical protein
MLTEIVLFDLPDGMTRAQVVENYNKTAPKWHANPDLIRKNYLYDPEKGRGGGVYLWPDLAAAQRWHDEAWITMAAGIYGNRPSIQYFETPIVVDNSAGEIRQAAE